MTVEDIADYPHLTKKEFVICMNQFVARYGSAMAAVSETAISSSSSSLANPASVRIVPGVTTPYLQITTTLRSHPRTPNIVNNDQSDIEDRGNESDAGDIEDIEDADPCPSPLTAQSLGPTGHIAYHIVYSATWRVPTMYLRATHNGAMVLSTSEVTRLLVSDREVRGAIRAVDFGGALGIQDHPELGTPFMWLHPCHTATMLGAVVSPRDGVSVGTAEYLAAWISLIGPAVGLALPSVAV
ncbi:hypothetical protein BX661DRAFT_42559 [Kickxella alabastrina]|uniref:uncharacterized protein n=1 Tax=Kickxella alabastrina TaxID=61397 RepID=UPI00221F07E6|nr:uncharacterized protein BX661DRAFT_42559 [Kickxella alabastrina]KAI7825040.1 hypothetical protein BX661DRAFT_42559 [Kickxella alabastrina]KAJ1941338.1 hypothetical protein GGF37_003597 [Kickxella alabastrina]